MIMLLNITLMVISVSECKAAEFRTGWATAYCITGVTASGTFTTDGRTVAGQRADFGKTVHIWIDDGSGQIDMINYIGTYVIEDTGGKNIREGKVLDIYMPDPDDCKQFGGKRILYIIE